MARSKRMATASDDSAASTTAGGSGIGQTLQPQSSQHAPLHGSHSSSSLSSVSPSRRRPPAAPLSAAAPGNQLDEPLLMLLALRSPTVYRAWKGVFAGLPRWEPVDGLATVTHLVQLATSFPSSSSTGGGGSKKAKAKAASAAARRGPSSSGNDGATDRSHHILLQILVPVTVPVWRECLFWGPAPSGAWGMMSPTDDSEEGCADPSSLVGPSHCCVEGSSDDPDDLQQQRKRPSQDHCPTATSGRRHSDHQDLWDYPVEYRCGRRSPGHPVPHLLLGGLRAHIEGLPLRMPRRPPPPPPTAPPPVPALPAAAAAIRGALQMKAEAGRSLLLGVSVRPPRGSAVAAAAAARGPIAAGPTDSYPANAAEPPEETASSYLGTYGHLGPEEELGGTGADQSEEEEEEEEGEEEESDDHSEAVKGTRFEDLDWGDGASSAASGPCSFSGDQSSAVREGQGEGSTPLSPRAGGGGRILVSLSRGALGGGSGRSLDGTRSLMQAGQVSGGEGAGYTHIQTCSQVGSVFSSRVGVLIHPCFSLHVLG